MSCRGSATWLWAIEWPGMSSEHLDEATLRLAAIVEWCGDAIVSEDLEGTITSWNRAAQNLFGYTAAEALGQSIRLIISPETFEVDAELVAQARRGKDVCGIETSRQRKDGTVIRVSLTISPLRSPIGALVGLSSIARVATAPARSERAARRLAAIVQSSDDAIVSKDLNGIVTSWNGAAERMFGHSADEMIGQPIRRIIPRDRQAEEDEVLSRIRQGGKVDHFETIRQRKDGTLFPISLTVSPDSGQLDGTVIGASKIARDISERRREARASGAAAGDGAGAGGTSPNTSTRSGARVAATLDPEAIVQAVTDSGHRA